MFFSRFYGYKSAETIDFTGFSKFSPIITPAGEFLAAREGLGYLIIYSSQVFKMDWLLMSIVLLCIMAMGLYSFINLLEKIYQQKV